LLENSFTPFLKNKKYVHNFLESEFFPKLRIVMDRFTEYLDEPINSRAELSDMFSRQNEYIYLLSANVNTRLYFRFLKGSMIYLQSCIMTNCAKYTNEQMRMDYISDGLVKMKEHFEYLYAELLSSYDSPSKV